MRLIKAALSRIFQSSPSLGKLDAADLRESVRHAEGNPGLVTYGGVWTKFKH